MADIRADVIALSDYVYERTRGRLDGLTDTEYFREPVPGCWTIRPAAPGKYQADHSDSTGVPPFTTIAWRLRHLVDAETAPTPPAQPTTSRSRKIEATPARKTAAGQ
jgi:DinB superfamily